MIPYFEKLKPYSRQLRSNSTECEKLLWNKLRKKQIMEVQFYRQKPLATFIVDFYAPSIQLVIEVDGGQHFSKKESIHDQEKDTYLQQLGLKVMRFTNHEIRQELQGVLETIYQYVREKKISD